jgi:hypothetical protein
LADDWSHLPGGELIEQGLADLARGQESVGALLVAIGAPRLRHAGLRIPPLAALAQDPELRLYRLLRRERPEDAYSYYNSLIRRLVSFEQALEWEQARHRPAPDPHGAGTLTG